MSYSIPDQINDAWPRVYTSNFTANELRTMIERADAIIDAYCGARFTVPFASQPDTPPLIKMLSVDLALLDVFNRTPNTPEWIRDRLTRAFEILKGLQDGTLVIPGAEEADTGRISSSTENYIPTFGAVPSLSEQHDPNRELDEAAARGIDVDLFR